MAMVEEGVEDVLLMVLMLTIVRTYVYAVGARGSVGDANCGDETQLNLPRRFRQFQVEIETEKMDGGKASRSGDDAKRWKSGRR